MKYTLERLIVHDNWKMVNESWVPARPVVRAEGRLVQPFWSRVKDAWGVFRGRYDVVEWPEGQ